MRQTLVPWEHEPDLGGKSGQEVTQWKGDWLFAIEVSLDLVPLDRNRC